VLALAGALAVPAAAADFRGGDTILIGSDEVVDDDLSISAQNVTVNGTVNGNLFVVGNQVDINGAVNGSVFIAGELLRLNGPVAGSAYLAGAGTASPKPRGTSRAMRMRAPAGRHSPSNSG
jgi:hypothetical protein